MDSQCNINYFDENGYLIKSIPKKIFKKFEDAVTEAHKRNEMPNVYHKFVAYKCKTCLRFHIGHSKFLKK
jgi:hypothetical protein